MLRALISYVSGATYSLKSTPNDRLFEKLFHGFLPEICLEEIAKEIFFSYSVLMPDLGCELGIYV